MCANPTNPNYHGPTQRALLMALDAWADSDQAPPTSRYPRVEDGTLVSLDDYLSTFPMIPGMAVPTVLNELTLPNFGPTFSSTGGRLTQLPPIPGATYDVLVPRADKDGLNTVGIRPHEVRVPLGTNVGWNVRASGRREGNLCALNGSFIPFAVTTAQRVAAGDPRQSLEERYTDHQGYVNAVRQAAQDLVGEGFCSREDADRLHPVGRGERRASLADFSSVDAQAAALQVEALSGQPEQLCCRVHPAVRFPDCPVDHRALHLLDRRRQRLVEPDRGARLILRRTRRGAPSVPGRVDRRADLGRELIRRNRFVRLRHRHKPPDLVRELAHVAWPVVDQQTGLRFF